jgi:O-antigen ligase/tetratricopeptide (TPR) repeat protein
MLAWVGVAAGAVYLIYIGGAWWGIYSPQLRIVTMLLAAATLGLWAFVARRNPAWRPRTVMWPVIAASIGSLAVSTLFSREPRVSLEYLGYSIILAVLYLLLVRLFADQFFRRRLAVLATMLFLVSAVAYLGQVVGGWLDWWRLSGALSIPPLRPGFSGLTYNNPSAALTMIALLGVPAVATFGGSRRRQIAAVVGVVGVVGIVALGSGSRAGWFALGLTAVIAPIAWLAMAENRALARAIVGEAMRSPWGRVGVVIVVLGGVAITVVLGPAVVRRAGEGGEDVRLAYAVAGIRMFEQAPIFGTGPGTWVIQRPRYTVQSETDYYIPHAHNIEAQTLAELGLVGAAAGLVLVGGILWLLRGAVRGTDSVRRRWGWAGGVGLLYFLLHQVLDFYVNMPAFLFAAAIPVAYLDATTAPGTHQLSLPHLPPFEYRRLANAVSIAVVVIAIGGLLLQEVPALRQAQAVAAADARDWAAADAPAREAAAMDPDIGSYQFTAGLTASRSGDHAAAAAYFERVASQDDLPEAWLDLAAEQAALGQSGPALASLQSALRLGFQRPAVAMPAGDLALRLGEVDLAVSSFAAAVANAPSLAGDPWWDTSPERAAILPVVISRAIADSNGTGWEIALMAHDPRATAMAAANSSMASLVAQAWIGDAHASAQLLSECRQGSLDTSLLDWCARIAMRNGDAVAAAAFRGQASLVNTGAIFGTAELRVSAEGMVGVQLPGSPADLWATYTFRRPGPWDILVPSLVHLRLENVEGE